MVCSHTCTFQWKIISYMYWIYPLNPIAYVYIQAILTYNFWDFFLCFFICPQSMIGIGLKMYDLIVLNVLTWSAALLTFWSDWHVLMTIIFGELLEILSKWIWISVLLSDANVRKKADQASIDRWEIWKNSCNKKKKTA